MMLRFGMESERERVAGERVVEGNYHEITCFASIHVTVIQLVPVSKTA